MPVHPEARAPVSILTEKTVVDVFPEAGPEAAAAEANPQSPRPRRAGVPDPGRLPTRENIQDPGHAASAVRGPAPFPSQFHGADRAVGPRTGTDVDPSAGSTAAIAELITSPALTILATRVTETTTSRIEIDLIRTETSTTGTGITPREISTTAIEAVGVFRTGADHSSVVGITIGRVSGTAETVGTSGTADPGRIIRGATPRIP